MLALHAFLLSTGDGCVNLYNIWGRQFDNKYEED